ncbi:MAG: M13 family metallopeptidase [Vicinamibacteria bacterium]
MNTPAIRPAVLAICAAAVVSSAPPSRAGGLDLAGIDRSVKPGDDFFAYANGTWLKTTEIPADKGGYGAGAIVFDRTHERITVLVKEAAAGSAPAGSDARKIGDYYASYLDQAGIEAKGLAPLQPTLDAIAALGDRAALARYVGGTLRGDVDALNNTNFYTDNLFGVWVAADLDDPTRYVPFLMQGGLDMPDRAYYVDASPKMDELRAKCRAHIAAVLGLAKMTDADARATRVFELEKKIAAVHARREDSEDAKKANNRWTRADFAAKAPGVDWNALFTAAGLAGQAEIVVWHPGAVTGAAALLQSEPIETWKDYLAFHAIDHLANVLPEAFGQERFAFHGTALSGTPQRRERAKRAVDAANGALGEAVGRLYVERHFPPAAKARVQEMVANLQAAFGRRIDTLSWMTPATKAKAKAKLAVLKVGVGYPDSWRSYADLEIVKGDALGNARRTELFEYRSALARLGRPVDRGIWVMTPQTVNAVNLPVLNAMNFPAAILQAPYFDPERPVAMDYGAIGAVIGHEISHSFDDQGAQFDDSGRMHNWWTPADLEHFHAAAEKLVKQYDAYQPLPDLKVNGRLTLSENIADVAGLAAAYDAYRLSLGGKRAPVVDGLSGDQQFFLSFAQSWRTKYREPLLRQQVLGDGHAPNEYRGDSARNLDAWYEAFGVKAGEKLYLAPADRVRVW